MTVSSSPDVPTTQAAAFSPPKPILASTLNRLQPAPETVVLLLALVIGSGTGCAVVLFHFLIERIHSLMLEDVMGIIVPLGFWTLACIPAIGGLLVGIMRWQLQNFGPNLSAMISASQGLNSVLPLQAGAKAVAASVSLGTGASLGPEGPSVEIGANIGMMVGQALQMSKERQRLLLGAGAAAGLAAGFNAPIAGVFFALEVVLGTTFAGTTATAVSIVLLSAVVAALIAQVGLGGQPPFTLPSYEVRSPLELPLYLGLGLFASLVSIAYTQSIQRAQQFFEGQISGMGWMSKVPVLLRPAIGGLCVGLVALQFPQVLGIGYETVEAMLRDVQFSLPLLLSLLVLKLAVTAISLGSGLVGGLFAPAMFLGASLGAAYGKAMAIVLPLALGGIAAPPAYAMVGMAALLAASVRAPLTAILLLFELTRDYRIILPLMAAVGFSVWLVDRLNPLDRSLPAIQPTSLATQPDETAVLHQLLVMQAMHRKFLTLPSTMSALEAGLALTKHQTRSALVVDAVDQLVGIVTLQDIHRTISRWETYCHLHTHAECPAGDLTTQTLDDICTKDLLYAHEDELIDEALTRMSARGLRQLPVVDRHNRRCILGLLDQEEIALVYSLKLMQQSLQPYLDLEKTVAADQNGLPTAATLSLPQV